MGSEGLHLEEGGLVWAMPFTVLHVYFDFYIEMSVALYVFAYNV